jgi:phosphoribosyl 1,2-cyclic phosphodiesterase
MNFMPIASSSRGNAYLVESHGVAPLLLECGISIKRLREKLRFGVTGIAGCLISHEHGDHSKAVKDLLKAGVDVFTSAETAEALGVKGHYRLTQLTSGLSIRIDDWLVLPFDLHHDVPTHGFLIAAPDGEKLLFIPDTSYIRNRFEEITILAIECNHVAEILSEHIIDGTVPQPLGRRVRRNHMSLSRVVDMLKANDLSRCREIWLLHLSDANSDEARMIKEVQEATGIPTFSAQSE